MKLKLVVIMTVTMLCSACVQTVKPWQRQDLARPEMAWETDAMSSAYRNHVFFSKEASSGGASVGGGGCGCN
ncbi:MAG: DUF4266 domain-containing protein [Spongiibacteraceae bacterium]